jgi:DNA-binding MarR family transcriptional regulator
VNRAIQPSGVTSAQLQVLALVEEQPDISSAELARRSEVTPQTMKDIVRCLERSGLVERRAHAAHGRILTLRLTASGQAALDHCRTLVDGVEEEMLAAFSAAERAIFINLLIRAGDALTP